MARLNICGFETGDLNEVASSTGSVAAQSTTKRTGSYALRVNPSAATANVKIGGFAANGTAQALGITTTAYFRFYLYLSATAIANNSPIARIESAAATLVFDIEMSGGNLVVFSSPSGTVTLLSSPSAGQWYRVEMKAVKNGTCAAKIDGGSEVTVTGGNNTIDYLVLGPTSNKTTDFYVDDVAIDDAAYPGVGQVNILKPNATGTTSAWTNGAGTSPTNVAEVPHDSNTSYIRSATISDETTVNLDSSATGGVSGTIAATKVIGIVRDEGGASGVSVRAFNSGNYDIGTTTVDPGSTYTALSKIFTTDPDTSAAWTTSGLDALEIGVRNMASVAVRCTALYAIVESTGSVTTQVTPSTLSLTTSLQTPTVLTPQYARPASLANTITLQTPTAIITQPVTPAKLSLVTATFAPAVVLKTIVTPAIVALILNSQTPVLFVITTFKTSAILEAQYADSQTFAANYAYSGIFEAQYADSQTFAANYAYSGIFEAQYADSQTLEVA